MQMTWKRQSLRWAVICASGLLVAGASPAEQGHSPPGAPFTQPWINGMQASEPELQVQRYDADTYVLRQSIRTNPEGPFIFLFFGQQRVLQIDTGAGGLKIRPTIDNIISDWTHSHGKKSLALVVAHSHAHGDHIAGDDEFVGRPDTTVVGHSPAEVAAFFHIRHWPEDVEPFELGGRTLDIIPSPGHEPAEISIYDRRTRLLLMGDELYPGRLYVALEQFGTYRKTIERIVEFSKPRGVSWILGNHIEMTRTAGKDYAIHAPNHPDEQRLELPYARLLELNTSLEKMSQGPQLDIHADFIFYPLP